MQYLFNSRILTHIIFWFVYYIFFGLLWAKNGDYQGSFFLEFVLMPIRIGAVYFTLHVLLPQYLLKRRFIIFVGLYLVMLFIGGVLQRFSIYFFLEQNTQFNLWEILNISLILRAAVLINTTVLLLLAVKILFLYFEERASKNDGAITTVEIKSDKRYYKVNADEILYLEGLGNYITYHLRTEKKIISYISLKKALEKLPSSFKRIHKSYVVNSQNLISYNQESIEIKPGKFLPIGNSYKDVVNQIG